MCRLRKEILTHKLDIHNEIILINTRKFALIKVAEHSFQEPMPNSPLLLSYLSFGARFLQDSRLTAEEFLAKVCAVAMVTG